MSRFEDLRREYAGTPLEEAAAGDDPFALFDRWWADALAADIELANGMVLATAGADGQPSARAVLLKGWDRRGFVFYSSYQSRKAEDLEHHPAAALLFWWAPLHRQIRIEGGAAKVTVAESDAYFATRPRASNLSAIASAQSQPVASRAELEGAVAALERDTQGKELERPENWGGYRVSPHAFEFWQGRPDRLHDRLRYRLDESGAWMRERLCP